VNRSSTNPPSTTSVDLQCRIKYQNKLPDIPFDPKFINYPFDPNRFIEYKSTTLEKNYKWDILNEQDLGVRIDLINQDYNRFDPDGVFSLLYSYALKKCVFLTLNSIQIAILHPIDEKLLEDESLTTAADQKR
jgi:hypothetical protein